MQPSPSDRRTLYPNIVPYDQGHLSVDTRHTLYYEQCGNPDGKPVVFLHGGPGSGCDAKQRRFFDPKAYRIVLFDQRGCGRSMPHAELQDNTTWHLVSDIEALRRHLKIDRWQVFGGSWGSTLALAYAQAHPSVVTELVLRGIFLVRPWEIQWFYQEGASRLFPEAWQRYVAVVPEAQRDNMVEAYYAMLTDPDSAVQRRAAQAWSVWEGSTSYLQPDPKALEHFAAPQFAIAFARIECHYFRHGSFLRSENQLLEDVARIRHIPGVIVQGCYDVVCPPTKRLRAASAPGQRLQLALGARCWACILGARHHRRAGARHRSISQLARRVVEIIDP